jgi:hypothetical protein
VNLRLQQASGSDALKAVLESSRAGARQMERGRFKLDWKRALDKIKDFQLTDPHRYVLELVQGAVAGGATSIDVYTDADDMIMTFDGVRCAEEDLADLFDYLFTQDAELTPLRQLALGVNAALGLSPKFIMVDSGDGRRGQRLKLSSHADLRVEPLSADALLDGTRVHVRERVSWRVMARAVGSRVSPEGLLLAEHCRHVPIPLQLNSEDLRRPLEVAVLARQALDYPDLRGELILPAQPLNEPVVVICMHGVRIAHLRPEEQRSYALPLVGVVDAPTLNRNASHSDVVRDSEFLVVQNLIGRGARELVRTWLQQALPIKDPAGPSDLERQYLEAAARLLLRVDYKTPNPPEEEALLDVPDMVPLALAGPVFVPLRTVWDHVRRHGRCQTGGQAYDVALEDLPEGMLPVLWPSAVLSSVLGKTGLVSVDDTLQQIASRVYNRRQREADPREAVLEPDAVLVKVAVDDERYGMKGEFGLALDPDRRVEVKTLPDGRVAFVRTTADKKKKKKKKKECFVHVTYLREKVLLGMRRIRDKAIDGAAILDCPDFEPTAAWDDVKDSPAYKNVGKVLGRALPALLRELCESFPALPPAEDLLAAGAWSPVDGETEQFPADIGAAWPTDAAAALARYHADLLIPRCPRAREEQAGWLFDWPLFHTLSGEPISLRRLAEAQAAGMKLRYVFEEPFGEGAPEGGLMLNITRQQNRILQRYLHGRFKNGKQALHARRRAMAAEAQLEQERERNHRSAELRRQEPRLYPERYLAVIDLSLDEGVGQAGISSSQDGSWVRFLVDGVPLPDVVLKNTVFDIHAVIQTSRVQPDATWSGVAPSSEKTAAALGRLVQEAAPELIDALGRGRHAGTRLGAALIWRYLGAARTKKNRPLESLPPGLVELPLVPTVDRGQLSLRELVEDAEAHNGQLLMTSLGEGRQLTKRPILRLDSGQAKLLRKLLHAKLYDFGRTLQVEREALEKLDRPPTPAVLPRETALRVEVTGDGIKGELGIPYVDDRHGRGEIMVLHKGVPLQVRKLRVRELDLTGVVDCARLKPTARYDGFLVGEAWTDVKAALRAAADRLVLEGCERLRKGKLDGAERPSVVEVLQETAARRFRGDADLDLEGAAAIDWQLAHAPLWDSADLEGMPLSLAQLRDATRDHGFLWVAGDQRGLVAPGRIIVRAPDEHSAEALAAIFGDRVRDGAAVLERDDVAQRRRLAAPILSPELDPSAVFAAADIDHAADGESHGAVRRGGQGEQALTVRGQVGPCRNYKGARDNLQLHVAVEGRRLCTLEVPHPVRGVGHLGCTGLIANRDWTGIASPFQLKLLRELGERAHWEAVEEVARRARRRRSRGIASDDQVKRLLMDALAALALAEPADQRPQLLELLKELPLFCSVQGQPLNAAQLLARAHARGKLLAVSDEQDEGTPGDGRLIVRASEVGLHALWTVVGERLERHDDAWARELAGQRRRRESPRAKPSVDDAAVALTHFHVGPTSGLAGLMRGTRSLVELHIDRRKVATRRPQWQPPMHVWVNDDRLQPDVTFMDVLEDEVYAEVMEVAGSQLPELVVLAAERWEDRWEDFPTDPLRQRICAWVLDHLAQVRAGAEVGRRSPERRLLRTGLWDCVVGKGIRLLTTERLLEAHAAGRLVTAEEGVTSLPLDRELVVVRVAPAERQRLVEALGELRDYTRQLERDEAHRAFLERKRVRRVDLDAVERPSTQRFVGRVTLTQGGWEGELGILADSSGPLIVHIFAENRPLVVHQIDGPAAGVCVVQCEALTPNDAFDDVERGQAFDSWFAALRGAVIAALKLVADDAIEAPDRAKVSALIRALIALEPRETDDEATRSLVERLLAQPLLVDTAGRRWSVNALREKAATHQTVASVFPATAAKTRYEGDQLVLILNSSDYSWAGKLFPVSRVDADYTAAAEARERMERAPTSAEVKWSKTVARAEVALAELGLHGELALSVPPEQGRLALLASGRVVERRLFNGMPGLTGYLGGDLTADREFLRVQLTQAHQEAIARFYEERLQQAVVEAEGLDSRARKLVRGRALAFYALVYLHYRIRHLSGNLHKRREMILTRQGLPEPLSRALDLEAFQLHDGSWTDLTTLTSGEDPLVVLCESSKVSDPSGGEVPLVIDDGQLIRPLLVSVLGQRSVVTYDRWRWKDRREEKKQKKDTKQWKASSHTASDRALTGLRSTLRSIGRAEGSPLSLSLLGRIQKLQAGGAGGGTTKDLGAGNLADVELRNDKPHRLLVNGEHPTYRAAAETGPTPAAMLHLSVAYLADLARLDPPVLTHEQALALLGRLAEHTAKRSG